MSNAYDLASIGTATGSRVDSAAKHIMACKVDSRLLMRWMTSDIDDKMTHLHHNKLKWCMYKDEIVLNSTKKMNNKFAHDATTKAYPMVLTTVGDMHTGTIHYLTDLYSKPSPMDFYDHVQLINNNESSLTDYLNKIKVPEDKRAHVTQQIQTLPDFRCQARPLL